MGWLARHSWWGLLFFSVVTVVFGITDITNGGPRADRLIPLALTGKTVDQLEAEGGDAYTMYAFTTYATAINLIALGALLSVVSAVPFRRGDRWSWWAMWVLPLWAFAVAVHIGIQGVVPGQALPPPMVSGPIVGVLAVLILLVSAPRFFGSPKTSAPAHPTAT